MSKTLSVSSRQSATIYPRAKQRADFHAVVFARYDDGISYSLRPAGSHEQAGELAGFTGNVELRAFVYRERACICHFGLDARLDGINGGSVWIDRADFAAWGITNLTDNA